MLGNIAKKVIDAVLAANNKPTSPLSLGLLMARTLDETELTRLEQLEADEGFDGANKWLVAVLLDTGLYKSDGDGFVELR
jgi:hypothetical protein